MTRVVLDEEGVRRLPARLHAPAGRAPEPIRDADDLHEVDLDAELRNRLPELPDQPHRS